MASSKIRAGVIGCGNICGIYFRVGKTWDVLDIVACADMVSEKACAMGTQYGILKIYSVDEMLADPDIDIVINLTVPKAHGAVAIAAVEAGKSVYNEKPLSITREDGQKLLALAKSKGVLVGCAPDTFLGGGLQTCRKIIDEGLIGKPIAANAFFMGHGPEGWHPDPEFFYKIGAGPMFDLGLIILRRS